MIILYADEDVDVLIGPLLKAKGFSVLTTRDAGMRGKTDREQLEHSTALGRAFLTHNRVDFERLAVHLAEEGKLHEGIIIATRRNAYDLARRLARFLELHKVDNISNQIWYM